MNFKYLTLEQAETAVSTTDTMWWEGWNLVVWRPNPAGFMRKNGRFNRQRGWWGTAAVVAPSREGTYKIRV